MELEPGIGTPLREQLENSLREQIRTGRLTAGTKLPSTRALAARLSVSRGVVLEAYAQLSAEGYLSSSQGAPTRVAQAATIERPPVPATTLKRSYRFTFDPGLPDLSLFPREQWLRSLRLALRSAPFDAMGPGDPRGTPELRNELMGYLGRVRGAAPEPEHTVICAGFAQGYAVLCRVLRDRGVERIALEEPGWNQHRLIAERAGLEPSLIPVDDHGIDVAALASSGCEVVVVTPAHQFPTGAVFGPERRAALLEWAEETDGLIVEDDYDSELRYDRDPVGALQGLAPERVAYVGSMSKRLAPGLRIGWVLSPSWLTGALTYEKALSDGGAPVIEQAALTDFIARGELDRHLRRVRLRYRARRQALLEACSRWLPGARLSGIAAGLFVLVTLSALSDEAAVVLAAARRGVHVEGAGGEQKGVGLVLGYANLTEQAIDEGVRLLADAVTSVR